MPATKGRRDELDMIGIRAFAATYRGRMKEAAELMTDYQARAIALSRGQAAGNVALQLAIGEALVGLNDQARARVAKAEDDGIVGEGTADDRLVVAAIIGDAAMARSLLAKGVEEQQKSSADNVNRSEGERVVKALAAIAERRPAEAVKLMEPVTFDQGHTDVVNIWAIAKMLEGDLPAAAKGLTFLNSPDARGGLSPGRAYAYAMLARTQVKMGQTDEARKNYEKFFEIFKDADPDLPLLVQARDEFAKLGS